jgi:PPOX class probable F420-dependent enzyme
MKTNLGPDDLGDLLDQPIIAVLATRRADDTILLSPVWFDWRNGAVHIWADSEENGKVRHIRRDPRVSFVVANAEWPYKGLEVRGQATITTDDFYGVLGRTAAATWAPRPRSEWSRRRRPASSSGSSRPCYGAGITPTRPEPHASRRSGGLRQGLACGGSLV